MNNYFYVYIYLDPRTCPPTPIYVGKGQGKRHKQHLSKTKNKYFDRKLKKIQNSGLKPIVEFAAKDITNEEAMQIEIKLIAKYGRMDQKTGTLCNHTDGGEGTTGYTHKQTTKTLFSKQRKGKKQTPAQYKANCSRKQNELAKQRISLATKGHNWHTPESRERIKVANLGRKASVATRKLMSKQRKGKKQTPAQYKANCSRIPKNTKKIKCLNNNIVYNSIKEAAKDLNVLPSAIGAVARNVRNHHKNYKFCFVTDT